MSCDAVSQCVEVIAGSASNGLKVPARLWVDPAGTPYATIQSTATQNTLVRVRNATVEPISGSNASYHALAFDGNATYFAMSDGHVVTLARIDGTSLVTLGKLNAGYRPSDPALAVQGNIAYLGLGGPATVYAIDLGGAQ